MDKHRIGHSYELVMSMVYLQPGPTNSLLNIVMMVVITAIVGPLVHVSHCSGIIYGVYICLCIVSFSRPRPMSHSFLFPEVVSSVPGLTQLLCRCLLFAL